MNINDKIPKLLKDSGIKVKELSRRTGISVAALNEYKYQHVFPSPENLSKICNVLRIEPNELLEYQDIPDRLKYSSVCDLLCGEERF